MKFSILLGGIVLAAMASTAGASPFVNLDFEQATVPPGGGQRIATSLALPGWTAVAASQQLSTVLYDNIGLDEADVALYDRSDSSLGFPQLQGTYDVFIRPYPPLSQQASLAQIGDIPAGTHSIQLVCEGYLGPPDVYVAGTLIPMVRIEGNGLVGHADVYAGDVTSFADMTCELLLSTKTVSGEPASSLFDDISFSSTPVPECRVVPWGAIFCIFAWRLLGRRLKADLSGSYIQNK